MDDQVGAAPVVFGQVGISEPPLELLPPELPLFDAEICMPELPPPPELELPPRVPSPEPLELEPPKAVAPELLEPELPNALTPELLTPLPKLELPFPKPRPELLDCPPPLLELGTLLVDPGPPSSAKSSGPPSAKGPMYSQGALHAETNALPVMIAPTTRETPTRIRMISTVVSPTPSA